MTEADDILAAEIALGVAEAGHDRVAIDPVLAARVEWWRGQLAPLDSPGRAPSPELWSRIAASLPANDNTVVRSWQLATLASSLVAAGLLAFVALRPATVVPPPVQPVAALPMVAAVTGEGGSVGVFYDDVRGTLGIAPTTLKAGAGDVELWVIPADGTPRSLGVIEVEGAQQRQVPVALRRFISGGATFAVSREAKGGSSTGAPQGPVIATGTIVRV